MNAPARERADENLLVDPADRSAARMVPWGGGLLGIGVVLSAAVAPMWSGLAGLGLAILSIAFYAAEGNRVSRANREAQLLMAAGRLDDADAPLADAELRARIGVFRSGVASSRAHLALLRGQLDAAKEHADRALAVSAIAFRGAGRATRAGLFATRALANVLGGRTAEGRVDIASARAFGESATSQRGRLALATALAEEQDGQRVDVRRTLTEHRRKLWWLGPRERMLVRALRRATRDAGSSAYRVQPVEQAQGDSDLDDWMTGVAPSLGAYVRRARAPLGPPPELPRYPAPPPPAPPPAQSKNARRTLMLWLLLIGMFMAIWFFLSDAPPPASHAVRSLPRPEPSAGILAYAIPFVVAFAGLNGLFAGFFVRHSTGLRAAEAAAALALDGTADDLGPLRALTTHKDRGVAASAMGSLVTWFEDRGLIDDALAECNRCLAMLTARGGAGGHENELRCIGARLFMAARRDEEALSLLASVPPTHPGLARSRFSVERLWLVHRGDWAGAARLADKLPIEVGVLPREELLSSVLTAWSSGADLAPFRADANDEPEQRAWLARVAPEIMALLDVRSDPSAEEQDALDDDESRGPTQSRRA